MNKGIEPCNSSSKAAGSSAIGSTNPNFEDCQTVIALPQKPLIPGFCMSIYVKYSLSRDKTENTVHKLKGKDLLKLIHEISSIQGDKVILIGLRRFRITELVSEEPLTVIIDHLKPYDKDDDHVIKAKSKEVELTLKDFLNTTSRRRIQVEIYTQSTGDFNYQDLADFGAGFSGASKHRIHEVLEKRDVHKRLNLTLELMKRQMEINKENDDESSPSETFRERIEPNKDKIPKHVLKVIEEELTKLELLDDESSNFSVTYNYLDWLTVLPWGNVSDKNFDVLRAEKVLDEDHYGLSDVKERILEFIAVGRRRGTSQGKIICLSGPPGVGKTSIARSIACALDRKFFWFSVGGLSDVYQIKGDRRSYIGVMPGKMVQCLKTVGTENPLVLIDEIDKIGKGRSGDPASALLEVMDPEQNANFLDHYLDVTIDLSKVLFVCTANNIYKIPGPLLDRLEVITLAGYVTDEKMHIARDYLVKTTCRDCGIKPKEAVVSDAALLSLIENYIAMTGEVTLTGRILPIGGVMEKTMATVRNQVKTIIFPKANQADFDELKENLKEGLDVHFVDEYEQIFELAFNYDH